MNADEADYYDKPVREDVMLHTKCGRLGNVTDVGPGQRVTPVLYRRSGSILLSVLDETSYSSPNPLTKSPSPPAILPDILFFAYD